MKTNAKTTLIKISDTNLRFAQSEEDIRGRRVRDSSGQDVGHIIDLLIDEGEQKIRFLEVASGGLLGIGENRILILVDAISSVDGQSIHINQTHEHIFGSPPYDPALVSESYYGDVYGHYGYSPFWGMGYSYPTYPYSVVVKGGEIG